MIHAMRKDFDASFTFASSSKVIKLIKTLNVKKASQKIDVPTKIITINADSFGNHSFKSFN